MKRRGTKQIVAGRLYGRFWLGKPKRESVPIPGIDPTDEALVMERCALIADTAERLLAADRSDKARSFAVQLGACTNAKRLAVILKGVQTIIDSTKVGDGIKVRTFGERWTSGTLAHLYPDHVKRKATSKDDESILKRYVYPVVGDKAIKAFELEDGERVMARLPPELSRARRRHVAQALHKLLAYAVYPAKIIKAHPLPKGFLPKLGPPKAKQALYPDEDAKLMACSHVPIVFRLLYGVIAREGFRFLEAKNLEWSDLDLERGTVTLDVNKTSDPRTWALDPGVTGALKKWSLMCGNDPGPFTRIPVDEHQADRFREDAAKAGITRAALFQRTATSLPLRFHDLRATFVTVSLANGKTETWVSDRTGHQSSEQIAGYRRAARRYAELNLGALYTLDSAIFWHQSESCQMSDKFRGDRRGSVEVLDLTKVGKKRPRTEGGTRTLTSFRTADFESNAAAQQGAKRGEKRGPRNGVTPDASAFDTLLTAERAQRERGRQWSAFEAVIESMAPEVEAGK